MAATVSMVGRAEMAAIGGAMVECHKKKSSDSYETLGSDSDWSH